MARYKVLKSGLTIIHSRSRGINGVCCRLVFGSGYTQEPIENKKLTTIAHLVEHMIAADASSEKCSPKQKHDYITDYRSWNAYTNPNFNEYFAVCHKKFLKQFIETTIEYIAHPAFTEEELAANKKVIIDEFYRSNDTPEVETSYFRYEYVEDAKSVSRLTSKRDKDLPDRINKLTIEDCLKHINDLYTLDNCTLIVNGNVKFSEVKKLAETIIEPQLNPKCARKLESVGLVGKFKKPCLKCLTKEIYKDKSFIYLDFRKLEKADSYKNAVFGNLLHKKFFDFIRNDQSLSYSPHACLPFTAVYNGLRLTVPCTDENFLKVLNEALRFVKEKAYKVTQEQIDTEVESQFVNYNLEHGRLLPTNDNLKYRFLEDGDFRTDKQRKRAFKAMKKYTVKDYDELMGSYFTTRPYVFLICSEKYNGKITHKMICDVLDGKKKKIEFEEKETKKTTKESNNKTTKKSEKKATKKID